MHQTKNAAVLLGCSAGLIVWSSAPTRAPIARELRTGPFVQVHTAHGTPANTWTTVSPTPVGRAGAVAAAIGNTIYYIGGVSRIPGSPSHSTARVDAYKVANNTWSAVKPLPSARSNANGATEINGLLYVSGGYSSSGKTATLYVYDPATDSWTKKANMPEVGCCGAQGTLNGLLYVYVGSIHPVGHRFFVYNPATNTWRSLKPPPSEHALPAGGVINGRFYLAGGLKDNFDNVNPTHVAYHLGKAFWETREPMPVSVACAASAVVNGELYVASGGDSPCSGEQAGSVLARYAPNLNHWFSQAPIPTARTLGAGAAAGGRFFVLGGEAHDLSYSHTVEAYTP